MSKDKGEKKPDDKAQAEVSPEEEAAKSKKKKLLILGIGGVGLLLGIGAGLFVFLSGGSDKKNANSGEHSTEAAHGEAAAGEHGGEHAEPPSEGHGSKKEEHGEAKGGHGGEKKGEAEKAGHGDEKKDEHKKAETEKGGHGASKDEHGGEKAGGHGEGEKKAEGGHGGGGEKKGDKKAAESKLEGVDFGCTAPLTPFHLNLGNPLENRYIRLEVSLEYGCAEEQKAEIEKRLPQLRDAIISVTSRKTREFLLGPDGKEQLRKEIHNRVNHYMTKKIDDVYITDILIE